MKSYELPQVIELFAVENPETKPEIKRASKQKQAFVFLSFLKHFMSYFTVAYTDLNTNYH
ncbi:CLUMA_CG011376, isoform A [Clunio marinus]|uniref:CLUMA_CG011376, isoform A n=1 Tax=Clunio marinus TaxID=568069 RepID=A0A1J1ICJ8_9DIPT|nr:CLUMA_CG011376, isoform A [Clunio marinus]